MSSAIHVSFDPMDDWPDVGQWQAFCDEHEIAYSPHTAGGITWYAGEVEVSHTDTTTTFSTYWMGGAIPEVARLAQAFWLQFGGRVSASPELQRAFLQAGSVGA